MVTYMSFTFTIISRTETVLSAIDHEGGLWTAVGDLIVTPTGGHVRASEATYEGTKAFWRFLHLGQA